MALNLSRNTKVFVSSVNGVTSAGGNVLTVDQIAGTNSGHAVGDIITFGTTNGSGTNFKCIVAAVNSGAVTEVFIPNNFRGSGYADNNTVTSTASTGSGANGLILTINGVTSGTTAEGGRTGTGLFVGNENDANTFRIGVLDGYSFSQANESSDITVTEAGASPRRSSKRFNDSLSPGEWSFQTYARPFKHGTNSFRTSGKHDMVENILWAAIAGKDITGGALSGTSATAVTCDSTDADVSFLRSDHHELLKLSIFFALENTTYRLNDCQVNQVEIDFAIDGIATLSWSGNCTSIDQVSSAIEDPSKAVHSKPAGSDATSTDATRVEKFNYVDTTSTTDADYLRNKLSQLTLGVTAQGGGKSAGGLDSKTYDIAITGGSLTITNNITYLTPETLGVIDQPIGSFSGSRQMSGTLTCYLDTKTNGSNQLLADMQAADKLINPSFDMSVFLGNASGTSPQVELDIPKAHISIPTIEVADVISTNIEFAAVGTGLDEGGTAGDEIVVKYKGSTTHSESGYAASGSNAVS
jgi:hypothetical protein